MFDFLFTPQGNSVHTNLITDQKPFFIYNQKKIEENISAVKQFTESLFSKPVSLSFSLKTQPNYKILKCINAQNLSLDVSSLSELEYALELGFAAHKIFLGGVGITDQAIKKALEIGVSAIHLNSIEIFKVAKAQKQKSSSASALTIRFHPTYLRGNKIGETKEALIAQLKNSGS
jgi:diaminopimelate decarboxylase